MKTYFDLLGEKNDFSDSAEVFFEWAAFHKSKDIELKQRKDPVRVFRTSPISDGLLKLATMDYEKNKSLMVSRAIQLVFSATDPQIFNSVMPPQLSIFEKALILKKECNDSAKIIIISNDPEIEKIKGDAEKESGEKFDAPNFRIMNTNDWLTNNSNSPDVVSSLMSLLVQKGSVKAGKFEWVLSKKK